jgi:hypothetical protein
VDQPVALTVEINRIAEAVRVEWKRPAWLLIAGGARVQENTGAWRIVDVHGISID